MRNIEKVSAAPVAHLEESTHYVLRLSKKQTNMPSVMVRCVLRVFRSDVNSMLSQCSTFKTNMSYLCQELWGTQMQTL